MGPSRGTTTNVPRAARRDPIPAVIIEVVTAKVDSLERASHQSAAEMTADNNERALAAPEEVYQIFRDSRSSDPSCRRNPPRDDASRSRESKRLELMEVADLP